MEYCVHSLLLSKRACIARTSLLSLVDHHVFYNDVLSMLCRTSKRYQRIAQSVLYYEAAEELGEHEHERYGERNSKSACEVPVACAASAAVDAGFLVPMSSHGI